MRLDPKDVGRTVEYLRERKKAYQLALRSGPAGLRVLEDLAQFCRANDSTFHQDPRMHALLEGRREVWLRILQHLDLPVEQLFRLYSGLPVIPLDSEPS